VAQLFLWKWECQSSRRDGLFRTSLKQTVKRKECVCDTMKYTTLRIPWRDIIFLNVLDPTEDKSDDKRGSFYDELERVFDQFPKYDMEIVLGDVNAKLKSEDIFKPKRR